MEKDKLEKVAQEYMRQPMVERLSEEAERDIKSYYRHARKMIKANAGVDDRIAYFAAGKQEAIEYIFGQKLFENIE